MNCDICCIGHITLDKIVTPRQEVYMPGGTSIYFSYGLQRVNCNKLNYKLITSLAESEMKSVEDLRKAGIEVEVIPSRKTVYFENIYGEDQNNRTQRVRAKADPFTIEKLGDVSARYIVLGSLLADDFSLEVIQHLSEQGTLVVDAQGYLREVRGEQVFAIDWANKLEALKCVDILKVNEHEILVLTGIEDQYEACKKLAEWGVKEVLLTLGSYGSIVYVNGQFYETPAYKPRQEVDATGCGDTYVMGYVFKRAQGADPGEAAHYASALASLKMEGSGPFSGTEQDVQDRLATQRHD